MVAAVSAQPYVAMALAMALCCLLAVALCPARRRMLLNASLLCVPFASLEVIHIPEYWTPVQVGCRFFGLGDLFFCFSSGGIAWLLATLRGGKDLKPSWQARRFFRRFLLCSAAGTATCLGLWAAGLPGHLAVATSYILGLAYLWWRFPRFLPVAFLGGIGFGLFYFAVLKCTYLLAPHFLAQWNLANLSGYLLFGVPVEETWWAFLFGALWPWLMAYSFDTRRA